MTGESSPHPRPQRPQPRHRRVLALVGAMIAVMTGLVIYSPTLYQMFCNLTGYGGTVQRAVAPTKTANAQEMVTVHFDANVAPGLPWEFRPKQTQVTAHVGAPTKVYYTAKNTSDQTLVARATFNVTPYQVAPYFFKIECFCFTEERLGPGESADMPLVFYVDEEMLKDKEAADKRQITLSYTFFKQKNLSDDQVAAARDLKKGSEETEAKLKQADTVGFENDAPRH